MTWTDERVADLKKKWTDLMLDKAPYGSPCNNCGRCCMNERCPLGVIAFGSGDSCPALEPNGLGGFSCGLIANPGKHVPQIVMAHGADAVSQSAAFLVAAGTGCDAHTEDEEIDLRRKYAMRRRALNEATQARLVAAKRIWSIGT